jgi:hypothetical protein
MKPQDHPGHARLARTPSRHPLAVLLSASLKYIVAGFALAAVAMHPELYANVIAERDRPDSSNEPPAA